MRKRKINYSLFLLAGVMSLLALGSRAHYLTLTGKRPGGPGLQSAATVSYTYDAAGRLTLVDYGNGTSIRYTYDAAGNLIAQTVTTPPPEWQPVVLTAQQIAQIKAWTVGGRTY